MTRALKQSAVVFVVQETESLDPFDVLGGSEACRSCSLMYPPCRAAENGDYPLCIIISKDRGKAISLFSLSRGEAVPPIQRLDAGGDFTPSEGVDSGRLRRPGNAAARRRGQEGQGHRMVPCPLFDSPNPPLRRDSSVARRNGGNGGSVPGVGSLLGRCKALRSACAICRA